MNPFLGVLDKTLQGTYGRKGLLLLSNIYIFTSTNIYLFTSRCAKDTLPWLRYIFKHSINAQVAEGGSRLKLGAGNPAQLYQMAGRVYN